MLKHEILSDTEIQRRLATLEADITAGLLPEAGIFDMDAEIRIAATGIATAFKTDLELGRFKQPQQAAARIKGLTNEELADRDIRRHFSESEPDSVVLDANDSFEVFKNRYP